ncbi:hypothetical protein [Sodalinema sp.]|uniref:hypothetical protein n=1 Tax=Sodalinema sp. TaxID=3080550 RepID=UPI00396F648C
MGRDAEGSPISRSKGFRRKTRSILENDTRAVDDHITRGKAAKGGGTHTTPEGSILRYSYQFQGFSGLNSDISSQPAFCDQHIGQKTAAIGGDCATGDPSQMSRDEINIPSSPGSEDGVAENSRRNESINTGIANLNRIVGRNANLTAVTIAKGHSSNNSPITKA